MGTKRFQTGSISVLFTVMILCVGILSVVSVVTARMDARMADRYAARELEQYQCENLGQEFLMALDEALENPDGALPMGATREGDLISATVSTEHMALRIQLRVLPEGETPYEVLEWSCTASWEQDNTMNLL